MSHIGRAVAGAPRPRLLACDIDGTLLDPAGRLRPHVRDAIRTVVSSGVRVVLATGRSPWAGISELCAELGLSGPQIAAQGALSIDPVTGRVVRRLELTAPVYDDALRFADALDLDPVVGTADTVYTRGSDAAVDFLRTDAARRRMQVVGDLGDVRDRAPIRVFLPTDPHLHRHVLAAATVWFAGRASLVWTDDGGVEVLAPGADKGSAVEWLARSLRIPREAVAAVGDGGNDITMLRYAAMSAAMAGAPEPVRRRATLVGGSNADDGVIDVLAAFFPDLADRFGRRRPTHPLRRTGSFGHVDELPPTAIVA